MELSWSPVAGAHGYVVTRLRFNDCGSWDYSSAVEVARVGSGVPSASDQVQAGNSSDLNRLVEGAWYQYSVAALRNGVEGERRKALLRLPAAGEPGPIWGLSAAVASGRARLSWGPASGAAFYRVCRGPDVVSSDDGPTSTSFTDSGRAGRGAPVVSSCRRECVRGGRPGVAAGGGAGAVPYELVHDRRRQSSGGDCGQRRRGHADVGSRLTGSHRPRTATARRTRSFAGRWT